MSLKLQAVLVAGGTGGHINAAIALGERLSQQGYQIRYLTGQRTLDYKLFNGLAAEHLSSWPLRTKNPFKLILALARNFAVFVAILVSFIRRRPRFIVGAGGYVCGPTLLAGKLLGIPIFIFEQNAVVGLTNKILARLCDLIFTHFKDTKGIPASLLRKVRVVGNPTRQSIKRPTVREHDGVLRVLIFGGSLGASQINQLIVDWVQTDQDSRVEVIHQTGAESNAQPLVGKNISYSPVKYLDQIQEQYAWCDVIVARAGASTVAELRIVKKPCFLIPFPQATDNHQWWNALQFKEESDFSVEVVDPKQSKKEMAQKLADFLTRARLGQLQASQSKVIALDSGLEALKEIHRYVGSAGEN